MKVCLKCHHLIDSTMNFCYKCGSSEFLEVTSDKTTDSNAESTPSDQPENKQPNPERTTNGNSQNSQNSSTRPISYQTFTQNHSYAKSSLSDLYPMNWYKFLINFGLWAGVVGNFILGILYMSGGIYSLQSGGVVSSETVYYVFEGLKAIDIIYGLICWAIAGYGIYTRHRLANYMENGPKCVYTLYGVGMGAAFLYNILVSSITNDSTSIVGIFISLIASVVGLVLNYIYFSKRDFLFVN